MKHLFKNVAAAAIVSSFAMATTGTAEEITLRIGSVTRLALFMRD